MKDTFRIKLEQLSRRQVEVESLLSDPSATNDMNRFRALSRERSDIEPISALFAQFRRARRISRVRRKCWPIRK